MKLLLILLASIVLTRIPFIGQVLQVINTMIHESGHALMALLTQGQVYSISLFANTEGATMTGTTSWIGRVLVSASGYVFSSAAAFLFLLLLKKGKHHWILWVLIAFAAVNLLLWVRNLYGILWLIGFLAFLIVLLRSGSGPFLEYSILLIAGILLVESVSSAFQIMWLSFASSSAAGDATNLARATYIPACLWGIGFFAQSLYFSGWAVVKWLK